MIELGREKRQIIRELCSGADGVLVRSAAEGSMGRVWVPELENPAYCVIHLGDFCFLFGICPKGEQAMELKSLLYRHCSHDFITPSDERWAEWLEDTFPGEYRIVSRYAMKQDKNNFSEETLLKYSKNLPEGFRIKPIDKRIYELAMKEEWSHDFCTNYETAEDYERDGLGFAAMKGRHLAAACSAYGISRGMIEIKVGTRKDYQRKGLALACSARLILACLEQGIYPSWDADSLQAASLAEKLGYIFDREYQVYQLFDLELEQQLLRA